MNLKYWLYLFACLSLLSGVQLFRNLFIELPRHFVVCDQEKATMPGASPFLCDGKMPIKQARLGTLVLVDRLSRKSAQAIADYVRAHDEVSLKDLDQLPGIGIKTIEQLRKYFF